MEKKKFWVPTRVQIFKNAQFGNVRTVRTKNGVVLFVARDVLAALGYRNISKALADHVAEDDVTKSYPIVDSMGRRQRVNMINESGLFALILGSKRKSAQEFKHWVTSEVLPQIGKTGGYFPTKDLHTGRELTDEEIVRRAHDIIGRTLSMKNAPNERCQTATQVAEMWGIDVLQLNSLLQSLGIIERRGGRWHLAKSLAGLGLTEDRHFYHYSLRGKRRTTSYLVWTPEGVQFLEQRVRWLAESLPKESLQLNLVINNTLTA